MMNKEGEENPYIYRQLEHERSFRVLTLKPAALPDADLQGSLTHHRIESEPNYKAIPYTWGDPILSDKLQLEGGDVGITANLALALRRFRSTNEEVFLWTDAICINQSDDSEKGSQVAMMSDIYRQAVLVLIWLGEAASGNFGINNQIRNDKQLFLDGNPKLDGIDHKHLLSLVEAARNKHADVVYQMRWFTRMWVVQEVMLASRALLCCGSYEIDWVYFAFATEILMGAFMSLKAAGYDMSVVARDFDGMAVWRGWKIVEMRQNFRIMSGRGFFVQSRYQQYGRFVRNLRNQDCKDDRDRVYALLGLRNSDVRINMAPDYKKTTFEVYAQFARLHLEHNDLEVLYDAGLGCRLFITRESDQSLLESDDYLPSWAPDFRKRFYEHWLPWHNEGQKFYAATELLAKVVIPDNDPRRIKFKAVLIRKVKGGGLIYQHKSYEDEKFPLSYMRDILKVMRDLFYKHNRLGKEYQNKEDLETALAHTIVSDGSHGHPISPTELFPHLNRYCQRGIYTKSIASLRTGKSPKKIFYDNN